MPLSLFEAAKKACKRANWRLSNLELQKILYLAQLRYKRGHSGIRLIDTRFEAWDLGPVSPRLYQIAKNYGSDPVSKGAFYGVETPDNPLDRYLYETVDKLENKSPAQLVALTHRNRGAWANYYIPNIRGIVIPDQAIDDEASIFSYP